jgi:hypothetical protein
MMSNLIVSTLACITYRASDTRLDCYAITDFCRDYILTDCEMETYDCDK